MCFDNARWNKLGDSSWSTATGFSHRVSGQVRRHLSRSSRPQWRSLRAHAPFRGIISGPAVESSIVGELFSVASGNGLIRDHSWRRKWREVASKDQPLSDSECHEMPHLGKYCYDRDGYPGRFVVEQTTLFCILLCGGKGGKRGAQARTCLEKKETDTLELRAKERMSADGWLMRLVKSRLFLFLRWAISEHRWIFRTDANSCQIFEHLKR